MSLKIGAIAQPLGTTVRTLRFYEENGLLHPGRTPGFVMPISFYHGFEVPLDQASIIDWPNLRL
ncbi:MerR family transcriptional regulator [Thiorhodococcus minor]|uniref:MerR family transcriptional regulator n=1 Tax=Thiorhodococcus minor TaxID=57489 RepID=UPI001FD7A7D5|nr:MerR family transcriptional regulator [Thiorhodococcus minor]